MTKKGHIYTPETVTLAAVREAFGGRPTFEWEGNCYAVACAVAPLVEGRPAYGHWLGTVSPRSPIWASRAGASFQRHGWVVCPDDRILDPTRWSFEARAPYIWLGYDADDEDAMEYDEGGQRARRAFRLPPPPDGEYGPPQQLSVDGPCLDVLCGLLGRAEVRNGFTFAQLGWLASGPLDDLGEHARTLFTELGRLERKALVPIDAWRLVMEVRS